MHPPLTLRTDPVQLKPRDAARYAKEAGFIAGRWKGLLWDLPCFETPAHIIEISNDDDPGRGRHYVIDAGGALVHARFDTSFIEELAGTLGLRIARDCVDEYVRLYLAFTRGQAGRVVVIDQIDQLPLREELTLITRRKLQSAITPMIVENEHTVAGCFLIRDKLFSGKAKIGPKGAVSLEPGAILADTLPVLDGVFEAS